MSMIKRQPKTYKDGRTKQAFKDQCDINKILKKAQVTGTVSHLQAYGGEYGDFSEAPRDLLEARQMLDRAEEIFTTVPSEVRREFGNDPLQYLAFVNDPANSGRLAEVLPQVAEPGSYFPVVDRSPTSGQERAPEAPGETNPTQAPESSAEAPRGPDAAPDPVS